MLHIMTSLMVTYEELVFEDEQKAEQVQTDHLIQRFVLKMKVSSFIHLHVLCGTLAP